MTLKLNISEKGKAWKLESEHENFIGKKLGDSVHGKEISPELDGYEFILTGASDNAGFAHSTSIEGTELRRIILKKGWGMHKKPRKEGKKKVSTPKGLRLRKTYRGNTLGEKTSLINLNTLKPGSKKLVDIFPEQNKPKESEKPKERSQMKNKEETEKIAEEIKEEVKEEIKTETPNKETENKAEESTPGTKQSDDKPPEQTSKESEEKIEQKSETKEQ